MSRKEVWVSRTLAYSVDRMREMKLKVIHVTLLDWFIHFIDSGKMEYVVDHGDIFFWTSYKKILHDCSFFDNVRRVGRYFKILCGAFNNKPLLYRHIVRKQSATKVYYSLNIENLQYLFDQNIEKVFPKTAKRNELNKLFGTQIVAKSAMAPHTTVRTKNTKLTKTKDISSTTRRILLDVLQEGSPFAAHKINEVGTPASKTLLDIDRMIKTIHAGTFHTQYPMDEKWLRRVDMDILKEMKEDWSAIDDALFDAAQEYKTWKQSKPDLNLTNSFRDFLYNPRTKKSLFLTCLSKNHSESGFASNKDQENIKMLSPSTFNVLVQLKSHRPAWNDYVYWRAMKSVVNYLVTYWSELTEINRWDYKGIHRIMENYGTYLLKTANTDPNYMAADQYHWQNFIDDFYAEMDYDLCPISIERKFKKGA